MNYQEGQNHSFLEATARERANLLVDISTALSTSKAGVASLNGRTTSDGFAIFYLVINVSDRAQLDAVMTKLHNIQNVIKITRTAG